MNPSESSPVPAEPLAEERWTDLPAIVHPSWSGCNLRVRRGSLGGREVVQKSVPPHYRDWIDAHALATALDAAGRASLGPAMLGTGGESEWLTQEALPADAVVLTLGRLSPARLSAFFELHRRTMAQSVDAPLRCTLAATRRLAGQLAQPGVRLPGRLAEALAQVERIGPALQGGPAPIFGWGSGNVSNVMLLGDGSMRLLGGTAAGRMDPLQNLGAIVAEQEPLVASADEVVARLWPQADRQVLARVRLFAVLEDIRAAAWAQYAEHLLGPGAGEFRSFVGVRTHKALRQTRAADFESLLVDAA